MARGKHILHRNETRELDSLQQLTFRHVRRRRDTLVEAAPGDRVGAAAAAALARVRARTSVVQSIVLAEADSIQPIVESIRAMLASPAVAGLLALRPDVDARGETDAVARSPDVIVSTPARLIDHIRRENVDLSGVSTCVVCVPPATGVESFNADLHFISTRFTRQPVTVVFVDSIEKGADTFADLLRRPVVVTEAAWRSAGPSTSSREPKEHTMRELPFDAEALKTRISEIVRAVHEDEDPVELTRYRDFVRRHTTIFNRGYVLAYLLKESWAGGSAGRTPAGGRGSRRSRGRAARTEEPRSSDASIPAAAGETSTTTVFVSIGRNRRIQARDLITFFTSADGVTQDDIGPVKILDNYSFVEVANEKAQAAVDELNGKELRGRKLTVSFARRK